MASPILRAEVAENHGVQPRRRRIRRGRVERREDIEVEPLFGQAVIQLEPENRAEGRRLVLGVSRGAGVKEALLDVRFAHVRARPEQDRRHADRGGISTSSKSRSMVSSPAGCDPLDIRAVDVAGPGRGLAIL